MQPKICTVHTPEQARCVLFATRRLSARKGNACFLQLSQNTVCSRHSIARRAAAENAEVNSRMRQLGLQGLLELVCLYSRRQNQLQRNIVL